MLLTLAAYAPVANNGFVWDDDANITENRVIQNPGGLADIWSLVRHNTDTRSGAAAQYFPLTHTSFWLQWQIHGNWPLGFHAVNVALHLAGAVIFWALMRELGFSHAVAWLAAALYALHPVCVESVAWATERKNTLSSLFYLSSMWAFLAYYRRRESAPLAPARLRWIFAAAVILFLLAMLAKSNTCVLPATLLLVLWAKQTGRIKRYQLAQILPLFVMTALFAAIAIYRERHAVGLVEDQFRFTLAQRPLLATQSTWFYLAKALWPNPITFFYPMWRVDIAQPLQYLGALGWLVVIPSLWFARHRLTHWPLAVLLIYLASIGPFTGIFDGFAFAYSLYADHWQYLALPAVTGMMAWILVWLWKSPKPWLQWSARIAIPLVLLAFLIQTNLVTRHYRNIETLAHSIIQGNPKSWIAYNWLSAAMARKGNVQAAIAYQRKALEHTDVEEVRVGLAMLLIHTGDASEGEKLLHAAIDKGVREQRPSTLAMLHLANLRLQQGRTNEAVDLYRGIIQIRPRAFKARIQLGDIYAKAGRFDLAREQFADAVEVDPFSDAAHLRLGFASMMLNDFNAAREHLNTALRLNPNLKPARDAMQQLEQRGTQPGTAPSPASRSKP